MNFKPSSIKQLIENRERYVVDDSSLTEAGVLLPVFFHDEFPHILFTKRTDKVEHHKGEISFPGGIRSAKDSDILQTALRETEEEIGVDMNDIEILGCLDDMATVTGFKIAPFAGIIPYPFNFRVNTDEIERLIEVPLPLLMVETRWSEALRDYKGEMLKTHTFNFNGDVIWGATAGIVLRFIEILKSAQSK